MDKHSATINKDGTVQSITFDPKKFTPEQAKQWLADNGYEIVDFLAAGPENPTSAKKAPTQVVKKTAKKK